MSNVSATKAFLEAVTSPMNKKPTPPSPEPEDSLDIWDRHLHNCAARERGHR